MKTFFFILAVMVGSLKLSGAADSVASANLRNAHVAKSVNSMTKLAVYARGAC